MTKTEKMILAEVAKRGYFAVETCYGKGPYGGSVQYGLRERRAMFKLVDAGILKITKREPWQDYNRGYSQSGNIFVVEMV